MRRCYKCGAKMETDYIVCPECEQEIERRRYEMTREDALKILDVDRLSYDEEEAEKFSVAYDMAVEALKDKKSGHWILKQPAGVWTNNYQCSECGGMVLSCKLDMPRFCGRCGAEMSINKGELYED